MERRQGVISPLLSSHKPLLAGLLSGCHNHRPEVAPGGAGRHLVFYELVHGARTTRTLLRARATKMLERGQPWFSLPNMLMTRHDHMIHRPSVSDVDGRRLLVEEVSKR